MEETIYFDSRPSTGYNGYYEFFVDSIPEKWNGELVCDCDWVTVYRYSKNRYNILVESNMPDDHDSTERTCTITGSFKTNEDELYDGTASESVVINVVQSGYTHPSRISSVPLTLIAYQESDLTWSYIINNYSEELANLINNMGVSIMYSVLDGETHVIEAEDIHESGALYTGTTHIIDGKYGFPVVSVNCENQYGIFKDGEHIIYGLNPSVNVISLGDSIYNFDIQCMNKLSYTSLEIDVNITSDADCCFAVYKLTTGGTYEMIGEEHVFDVDNPGYSQSKSFTIKFAEEALTGNTPESYLISGSTIEMYGNTTKSVEFIRDIRRIVEFGIRKGTGLTPFDFDGLFEIENEPTKKDNYSLTYNTNYVNPSVGAVKFVLEQDSDNKIINPNSDAFTHPFNIVEVLGSPAGFSVYDNTSYEERSARIIAICYNDSGCTEQSDAPLSVISITQLGREKKIDITIDGIQGVYNWNVTGGTFTIGLSDTAATITSVVSTGVNRLNNITKDVQGDSYNFTFVGNNTGWTTEEYAITVTAEIENQLIVTSKTVEFVRNFNNSTVTVIGGRCTTPQASSSRAMFSTNSATYADTCVNVELKLHESEAYDMEFVDIFIVNESNPSKNTNTLRTGVWSENYMIGLGINNVQLKGIGEFGKVSSSTISFRASDPGFENGDFLTVYAIIPPQ